MCGFLLVVLFGNVRAQEINDDIFNRHFVDKTMRVDYFHAGGLGAEILGLDQIVSDGVWAGSRSRLVDNLNLLIGSEMLKSNGYEWEGVLSRLVAEENEALNKINRDELSEAFGGDSHDYFTLWENRN